MKNLNIDIRLLLGLACAHALIYFSFHDKAIFWYIFTGSILALIAFSKFQGDVDDEASFSQYILVGVISGLLIYFIFWLGIKGFELLNIPFQKDLNRLYKWFAPHLFWQYIALILVAAPGEELFWRGFIQKRLMNYFKPAISIALASILYATVHIYSGSWLLMLAALLSGIAWGMLYYWKKSMPMAIVSHIIFDIMIFMIAPFR
ncbi:CPBP family intramembrane glutamic endopeptidase [Bacillus sp. FJAT-29814]|uniref:CPBP family intramembrane glutamic endopeptidase n=1 Tax=Bacillus sp. FJAT-29814 TaxID=1729688 RepID=UPI00082D2F20|nr:CPBP family intramembrane glutamic endopeptidase [Bacillus sp. FJAT-29814]